MGILRFSPQVRPSEHSQDGKHIVSLRGMVLDRSSLPIIIDQRQGKHRSFFSGEAWNKSPTSQGVANAVGGFKNLAGIVIGIVVILFVVRFLRGCSRRGGTGPEKGVKEERSPISPAACRKGSAKVEGATRTAALVGRSVGGRTHRSRHGRDQLEQLVYGLGAVAKQKAPHPRWPAQLSNRALPDFQQEMVARKAGKPSRWI